MSTEEEKKSNKFSEKIQEVFENVAKLLNGMLNDRSVPRNIKRKAQKAMDELEKENETPGVIASNVLYMVDDLSQDPNLPFHARSTIWRIVSILETIQD
ncbi:MAG: UPF0147 family protein [Promethearchaeia archaeon]